MRIEIKRGIKEYEEMKNKKRDYIIKKEDVMVQEDGMMYVLIREKELVGKKKEKIEKVEEKRIVEKEIRDKFDKWIED